MEEFFSRVRELLTYDASAPLIFNSGLFLFLFAGFLAGYVALRRTTTLRILYVIAFSIYFYYKSSGIYFLLLVFVSVCDYIIAHAIARTADKRGRKQLVALSVVINLGMLAYFKYTDFFISAFASATGLSLKLLNIALPVGISFYTFQIISYNIDVYRGEKAQKIIINLAAYVTMFPQLIAGPIVRYSDIALQLNERKHSFRKASEGITRFVIGLAKKILLANQLGEMRRNKGVDYILEHVCKLDVNGRIAVLVKEKIELLKKEGYIHE